MPKSEVIREPIKGELVEGFRMPSSLEELWSQIHLDPPAFTMIRNHWGDWGEPKPEKILDANDPLKRTPKQIVETSNAAEA